MDDLEALNAAAAGFGERVVALGPDDWAKASPCEGWTVRDVVNHVVAGNRHTAKLLAGASREEATADLAGDQLGDDPVAAWTEASKAELAGFAEPGALERTLPHVMGDVPAAMLVKFRTADLAVHGWDVARATGGDERIDPEVADRALANLAPMADMMASMGMFGTGPSGTLDDAADVQTRLLDLTGRRP